MLLQIESLQHCVCPLNAFVELYLTKSGSVKAEKQQPEAEEDS